MGSENNSSSVALVNFVANEQMPQLVNDYYGSDSRNTFNNSRLVLKDSENNMQFSGATNGVVKLQAGNVNANANGKCQQYDSLDVGTPVKHVKAGVIQNGCGTVEVCGVTVGMSSDDDDLPVDITTGNGDPCARISGEGIEESYDGHCHAPLPDTSSKRAQKQLIAACCVSVAFMIGEVVGGYYAGSLAIMTDAAHLLSDVASFGISIFALWVARRPATMRMSFGFYRAEVLGAVISVLIIWILTGILCYLAVMRIVNGNSNIDPDIMLITAGVGVGINITLIIILQLGGGMHLHSHGGGGGGGGSSNHHQHLHEEEVEPHGAGAQEQQPHQHGGGAHEHAVETKHKAKKNINVRAAFIHVIGDLIQSIGVLIAAGIIKAKPSWTIVDPICTFMFSILVLVTTITILRDAINVLMEGVPRHINYPSLKEDLAKLNGVVMAHSLHVWSLTTSRAAMAVHLAIDETSDNEKVLQDAFSMVRTKYGIHFSTIQVEKYQHFAMTNCVRCTEPC